MSQGLYLVEISLIICFTYINILRNYFQNYLGVLRGDFEGLGFQRHPDTLLAKNVICWEDFNCVFIVIS